MQATTQPLCSLPLTDLDRYRNGFCPKHNARGDDAWRDQDGALRCGAKLRPRK